jgi:hypothetical protein
MSIGDVLILNTDPGGLTVAVPASAAEQLIADQGGGTVYFVIIGS